MHIHWLTGHARYFTDKVSGKDVYIAKCRCGKQFMTDTLFPIPLSKVEAFQTRGEDTP